MADDLTVNDRRARYTATAGQTVFDIDFPVDELTTDDIAVYANGSEVTTGFTVDLDAQTVTFSSGRTLDDIIVVEGSSEIKRESTFPLRGNFLSTVINKQIRRMFYILQEKDRDSGRQLQLNKSESDSADPVLPLLDAGRILIVNSAGDGFSLSSQAIDDFESDIAIISPIAADIQVLADIEDGTDATGAIQTVAGDSADVQTVAGISSSVQTVAGDSTAIQTVATDLDGSDTIGTVSTNIADINACADAITDIQLAEDYATKDDGYVTGTDNSAKSWAIGGTGDGDPSDGSAKAWAVTAEDTEVAGGEYSAKHYAAKAAASVGGVKVSANDTTPDALEAKLLVGDGLALSTQNDGANETRTISQDIAGATSGTVASDDKILFADADDSDGVKRTTAGDIAGLATPGGLVLLGSYTASAATSVDIGTGLDLDAAIDGTYDKYIVELVDFIPAEDGKVLYLRTSTDGGSTFDGGAYNYEYTGLETSTSGAINGFGSTGATLIQVTQGIGSGTAESCNGEITLYNPSGATNYTQVKFATAYMDPSADSCGTIGTGLRKTAGAVDALRLFMNSGDIESGTFYFYGVRKS
jgi:hypothetical protein